MPLGLTLPCGRLKQRGRDMILLATLLAMGGQNVPYCYNEVSSGDPYMDQCTPVGPPILGPPSPGFPGPGDPRVNPPPPPPPPPPDPGRWSSRVE